MVRIMLRIQSKIILVFYITCKYLNDADIRKPIFIKESGTQLAMFQL